jgi:glycerol-3-phosphate dehydrogenase (NAD(P)+)
MMKIAVLGDGAWGSALAMNLARNGHEVIVWGAFPDYIEKLQKER